MYHENTFTQNEQREYMHFSHEQVCIPFRLKPIIVFTKYTPFLNTVQCIYPTAQQPQLNNHRLQS